MNRIQQDWQFVRLSEVCDLQNGFAFKSTDYVEYSNTLNCRMSNIRPNGVFDLEHNPKYLPDTYIEKYKNYILKDGDVIIAMTDMATKAKILGVPTVVLTKGKNLLLNQRVGKLVIKNSDRLYFPYLQYALNRDSVKRFYLKFAGGGLQINLGKEDLLSVKIPLPPLSEQKRIAAILDKADAIRRKRKEAIALTEELLRSTFLDMFGDPVTNPKGWDFSLMKTAVLETQYGTSAKSNTNRNGMPILRMNNITYSGEIDLSDIKWCDIQKSEEEKYTVKRGDLLFNRTNSPELVGKTAVWRSDKKYAIAGYLVRVRFNENIALSEYVSAFLNSSYGKKYLYEKAKPSNNMSNFSASEFLKIPIPLPPIELQKQFYFIANQVRLSIHNLDRFVVQSNNLFNSLLQKAFSGEL